MFKGNLKPINVAGSLCLYDNINQEYIIISKNNIDSNNYPISRYTPIGIVVIPLNHNLYGTKELAIMSLVNMNPNNPDNGGGNNAIPFGYKTGISGLNNYQQIAVISDNLNSPKITGYKGFGYVPSTNIYDYFTGSTVSPSKGYGLDTVSKYPSLGSGYFSNSPYLENGMRNEYYSANGNNYYNGLQGNCLSDLDGKGNANDILKMATAQTNWKTASTITLNTTTGYFPASCCCWRFKTNGTNQGDWYLPSAGEIGYLVCRILEIQETLEKVIEIYGSQYATTLNMGGNYWPSTQYNNVNTRYLYTGIGGIGHMDKTSTNLVRAFTRIKAA